MTNSTIYKKSNQNLKTNTKDILADMIILNDKINIRRTQIMQSLKEIHLNLKEIVEKKKNNNTNKEFTSANKIESEELKKVERLEIEKELIINKSIIFKKTKKKSKSFASWLFTGREI